MAHADLSGPALGGILLAVWVTRVTRFAKPIIQVEAGQNVISTGPYAVVRHPTYLGGVIMWLFTPLALGSYFAWPAFTLFIPFYVYRLLSEEKVLRRELPGYPEYCLRAASGLSPSSGKTAPAVVADADWRRR